MLYILNFCSLILLKLKNHYLMVVSYFNMNNGPSYFLLFSAIVTEARYLTATGLFSWSGKAREKKKTVNPPPKAC